MKREAIDRVTKAHFLLLLLVLLAACQGRTIASSEEELAQLLLTAEELPAEWQDSPYEAAVDEEGDTYRFLCQELPRRYTARTRAEFEVEQVGPFLTHALAAYPSAREAELALEEIGAAATACSSWSRELASGESIDWEVQALELPGVNGRFVAIQSTSNNAPLYARAQVDQVFIQESNVIITLSHLALGQQDVNSDQTALFANLALEKLP